MDKRLQEEMYKMQCSINKQNYLTEQKAVSDGECGLSSPSVLNEQRGQILMRQVQQRYCMGINNKL